MGLSSAPAQPSAGARLPQHARRVGSADLQQLWHAASVCNSWLTNTPWCYRRCLRRLAWHAQAGMVGSRRARQGEDIEVQMYSGYDAWEEDSRKPNFTGCDWKTCHPKSVVRPLGVAVMNIHHFDQAAPGARRSFVWLRCSSVRSPESLFFCSRICSPAFEAALRPLHVAAGCVWGRSGPCSEDCNGHAAAERMCALSRPWRSLHWLDFADVLLMGRNACAQASARRGRWCPQRRSSQSTCGACSSPAPLPGSRTSASRCARTRRF